MLGLELLLFGTFYTSPNVSRVLRAAASQESVSLHTTLMWFWIEGTAFRWPRTPQAWNLTQDGAEIS